MVIFITSDKCKYCEAMKRDTWCDQTVGDRLAGDFVAIELTPAKNRETLSRIDVKTYPMTLIGIPEGKIVEHRTGYQPARAIHRLLSEVGNRIRHR